jgi:hypothetical protein
VGVGEPPVEPPALELEPRLEPLGLVVRRALRRALGALAAVAFLTAFGGRAWPGWDFVTQAVLGAAGLVALAVLARPVSHRPLRACLRSLTLGFVAPAWGLTTYVAGPQLRAIGATGDLAAGWAAAQAAVQRLALEWSATELAMIVSLAIAANVATTLFSGARDCGPALLMPLPGLLLLIGFGHASSVPFALFASFALSVAFILGFHVVERPRPRLLSGERREGDGATL